MKHTIDHDLGAELATKATKAAFDEYARKFSSYNPRASWTSDRRAEVSFKVKLAKLDGVIEIYDSRIDLDLDVPLVFRVFKERALSAIDREVRVWIEKAKRGELS